MSGFSFTSDLLKKFVVIRVNLVVPLWVIIIFSMFFYISKRLFTDFLQFKGNFAKKKQKTKKTLDTVTELF